MPGRLFKLSNVWQRVVTTVVLLVLLVDMLFVAPVWFAALVLLAVFGLLYYELLHMLLHKPRRLLQKVGLAAVVAAVIPVFAWLVLRQFGSVLLLWLVLVLGAGDTAAFVCGKKFGKHKLAPRISPNKTVEGAVAGVVAAAAMAAVLLMLGVTPVKSVVAGYVLSGGTQVMLTALLAAGFAVVGQMGDLSVSKIKRHCGVKDSSYLLPGHGGLFDRLDSYLFALPLFWLFCRWCVQTEKFNAYPMDVMFAESLPLILGVVRG